MNYPEYYGLHVFHLSKRLPKFAKLENNGEAVVLQHNYSRSVDEGLILTLKKIH